MLRPALRALHPCRRRDNGRVGRLGSSMQSAVTHTHTRMTSPARRGFQDPVSPCRDGWDWTRRRRLMLNRGKQGGPDNVDKDGAAETWRPDACWLGLHGDVGGPVLCRGQPRPTLRERRRETKAPVAASRLRQEQTKENRPGSLCMAEPLEQSPGTLKKKVFPLDDALFVVCWPFGAESGNT